MSARRPPARPVARRNPGVVVHRMLWSMSYRRRVRITLRDGHVKTAEARACWTDEQRPAKLGRQDSTVGFVLDDGSELRVDAIERVQLPIAGTQAAFAED